MYSDGEELLVITRLPSSYRPMRKFHLSGVEHKHYQQQFGDMYFYRLAMLKPAVEQVAKEAWADFEVYAPYSFRPKLILCR